MTPGPMFSSYVKSSGRFFRRHKTYTALNLVGLSTGLACAFMIFLWASDEVSFNRFHEDGDQLYRVMRHVTFPDGETYTWESITYPLAQVMLDDYTDIEDVVLTTWSEELLFASDDVSARETGRHVGPSFFSMFSYPLLAGDLATALEQPNAVAISRMMAEKHFGADWPNEAIGQTLRLENDRDVAVTAVFEDFPANSSLQMDFAVALEDFRSRVGWLDHWGNSGLQLFAKTRPGAQADEVSAAIADIVTEHHESTSKTTLFLHSVEDMYLQSRFENGVLVGGRITYVRLFVIVGFIVLLIASINFMNLATARSEQRAREIGVRKSVGASKGSLVAQFLTESVLLALVAFLFAVVVVLLLLPAFNGLTEKSIGVGDISGTTVAFFCVIAAATGLLAGSYPALYLSRFNAVTMKRASASRAAGRFDSFLRRGLVVFQFAASFLLIVATVTVFRQIDYIQTKDLGLDKSNLAFLPLEGDARESYPTFREQLLQQPGIASVAASSTNPLSIGQSTSDPTWDGKDPDADVLFHIISTGYDFPETMGMDMVAGRSFAREFADSSSYVINERAAKAMEMAVDDAIGKGLSFWGNEGTIVGVVRDFNMTSLYNEIEPTIIRFDPSNYDVLFVRTQPGGVSAGIAGLERVHNAFNPEYPLEYSFLDDDFRDQYRGESVTGKLANTFAILAVLIACLGLFGLASHSAERRTREIGVRKVFGASIGRIVLLLTRDYLALVLVSLTIATPIAWYVSRRWLEQFAFHTDMSIVAIVVAGILLAAIALAAVSGQSIRAARLNPVHALRYE